MTWVDINQAIYSILTCPLSFAIVTYRILFSVATVPLSEIILRVTKIEDRKITCHESMSFNILCDFIAELVD